LFARPRWRDRTQAQERHLVENAGRLVSKDELARTVWREVTVADESVTRCVSEVRLALGDQAQTLIKTVPRRGYVFAAAVCTWPGPARWCRPQTPTRKP
jgi:adenylate cyclase